MKKTNRTLRVPVYRLELVKDSEARYENVTCARDVACRMKAFADSDRENMVCLLLDARNRVVGQQLVAVGTLSACLVHPREVFKAAILRNAASIILAHNHPSGDVEPSEADLELTRRIADAGQLLGIHLADHVIVAPDGAYRSCKPAITYLDGNGEKRVN
jgi:DNA repair protein RadC